MAEELEDDVPASFSAAIRALKKGETLSKAKRYSLDMVDSEELNEELRNMRRTLNAVVSRQRKGGSNFRVESTSSLTHDNDAILSVVAITRTA